MDPNIERKTKAKRGKFNIRKMGRTDKAIMSIYQSQKRKEQEVRRQKEADMKNAEDKIREEEKVLRDIASKEKHEYEERLKVEIERQEMVGDTVLK